MKDELRKLAHFAGWLCAGFLLFSLLSCGPLFGSPTQQERLRQEAAQAAKDAAPFLPPPWNWAAYGVAALVTAVGGHRTVRHLAKRRAKAIANPPAAPRV
jgi:hypothetical protein